MRSPVDVRSDRREALRGSGIESVSVSSPNRTRGPDRRIMATPDGGGPLDSAKIVSPEDMALL
jgi:hypothetical protein